jgi:uncharacterized protein YggE
MSKEKKVDLTKLVAIAAIAVVLIVAAIGLGSQPKEVNVYNTGEDNLNLLSVSSTVTKEFAPDMAEIVLSVVTTKDTASESQAENAEKANAVITALKLVGVRDNQIETTGYRVNQQYEWDRDVEKSVPTGYKTTNTIKITLDNLNIVGSVVDAAVKAGANDVSSISFTLSENAQMQAKNEVLQEAAMYAKSKAQNIASGLNVVIGEVHSISETSYNYYPNYRSYDMIESAVAGSVEPTPVSPSDVSISATVSVQFEI